MNFEKAQVVLKKIVGRADASLRQDQWVAIDALVNGKKRVLVVQRTGWGKSAVYFVASALLRELGAGPTVIVSPLLSLMRNQVEAASRAGINAKTINSSNLEEWDEIHQEIKDSKVDVILVSPERLNNPFFREQVLSSLAKEAGLLVVDEAHCISDWGHDFRPDYRRIKDLLNGLDPKTPVLATTATANKRVSDDIMEQLKNEEEVILLRGELTRESLSLNVRNYSSPQEQLAWLNVNLPRFSGSGIIYCLTVASAEQVSEYLQKSGFNVRSYSGQSDAAERLECEQELMDNKIKALVSTSALGMGFDKPDLAFVIHIGAPSSPISYYQQVGRAGRGTDSADVYLLPSDADQKIWDWFGSMGFPEQETVNEILKNLHQEPVSTVALEKHVSLKRTHLETTLKVLDVEGAVRREKGGWVSTGKEWFYDRERYEKVAANRLMEQQQMISYENLPSCRMAYLRERLDDIHMQKGWVCGKCDRCSKIRTDLDPGVEDIKNAAEALSATGVLIASKRMWPNGLKSSGIELSGKIDPGKQLKAGFAVSRLDTLGLGNALRDLFDGEDQKLPDSLKKPVMESVRNARLEVDAIVMVSSESKPLLVSNLTQGVSKILQVPTVGSVGFNTAPSRHEVNSTQRVKDLFKRLNFDKVADVKNKRVLIIDDRSISGWTLALVAYKLMDLGAQEVNAFVLSAG